MRDLSLFIPYNINYFILENKKLNSKFIYLYNEDYYFCINSINSKIFINKDSNTIKINNLLALFFSLLKSMISFIIRSIKRLSFMVWCIPNSLPIFVQKKLGFE